MRKVRAHSTHEKLIYSLFLLPNPSQEKKGGGKKALLTRSLPSRTGLASPFDLRMNQFLVL